MITKPNTKVLSHEQVKAILEKSELNCIESKPGFLEGKKNLYFIIKRNDSKIKLKVTPKEFQFTRIDPGWVLWGPVIVYSFLHAAFKTGPIILLGFLGLTYLVNMALNGSELKVIVTDINEVIHNGIKD